ncbi:hypothetical protein V6582_14865 [Agrobacterium vitis]|uniref:AbiJ-NTD4 domain-containing protein n=1 Tax=Agrobacterium vitis TaxID=373 RepID=UPI0012E86D53|nr:hypothetical protein [Agrobacterium vitis]MVA27060.1 hypothetical protein [Agrobacterium vitis]
MITDIFARRYAKIQLRSQYFKEDQVLCNQLWKMMSCGLLWNGWKTAEITDVAEAAFRTIHDNLALELGVEYLSPLWVGGGPNSRPFKNSYATVCKNFLINCPDDFSRGDVWMKERLSLAELAFALRGRQIAEANANLQADIERAQDLYNSPLFKGLGLPGDSGHSVLAINKRNNESFEELIEDLNQRLKLASYSLTYHNGLLQLLDDQTTGSQIEEPFWPLVGKAPWLNVDRQMDTSKNLPIFRVS